MKDRVEILSALYFSTWWASNCSDAFSHPTVPLRGNEFAKFLSQSSLSIFGMMASSFLEKSKKSLSWNVEV